MMGAMHGGFVKVLVEVSAYLGVLLLDSKHRESIQVKSDTDFMIGVPDNQKINIEVKLKKTGKEFSFVNVYIYNEN